MKRISILFFTLFNVFATNGQNVVLKKEAKSDTLYLTLTQTDTNDRVLNKKLYEQFENLVKNFNKQDKRIVFKVDSLQRANYVSLTMGKIKYVTWKRNLWVTALNLAMLGG